MWVSLFVTSGYSFSLTIHIRKNARFLHTHTNVHIRRGIKRPVYFIKHNGDFYVKVGDDDEESHKYHLRANRALAASGPTH